VFYKIIIECGHMGAGNGLERIWFIKGENPLTVLQKAIKLIQEISKEEYISGINNYREARLYQG